MIFNGLSWKQTEIILSFLRLHPSTAFHILLLTMCYSISSKGFFPTVVDIMGSKITADGDCSHEKTLAPWKKSYDQPRQHIKSRDITLPTKVHLIKAMVFPVVMYGCESRTMKKAECQRIDAFALWCWRRLLRVPWTARRSKQSIL